MGNDGRLASSEQPAADGGRQGQTYQEND